MAHLRLVVVVAPEECQSKAKYTIGTMANLAVEAAIDSASQKPSMQLEPEWVGNLQ
jgi:hypothetical protein